MYGWIILIICGVVIKLYQIVVCLNTICVLVAVLCIFLILRQKTSVQQQITLFSFVLLGIISFGYWFLIQSKDLSSACLAQKMIYIGSSNIFYCMLIFFSTYCNVSIKKRTQCTLIIANICIMFLAVTFDKHKLFYKSVELSVNSDGVTKLVKEYGIAHSVFAVLMAGYVISIMIMCILNIKQNKTKKSRKNTLILFLVVLFPTAMYMCDRVLSPDFYLVPYGILISQILILDLVYELGIYDFNNTAQEFAYDALDDAVLTIDNFYRFKGCNNKAKELFPSLKNITLDDGIGSIDNILFEIIVNHYINDFIVNGRIYYPEIKKIKIRDKVMGFVIWFYDVTAEREKTELLKNYQKDLEHEVISKTAKLQEVQEKVILGFANVIESRDNITGGHIKRTSTYINILIEGLVSEKIYSEILTPSYIAHIKLAAPLHDIGKIAVPDVILNKKGRFTLEEFKIMKNHTTLGARIIDETLSGLDDLEYYHLARELALYHHERWDGSGYPEGLKGTDIPLCARIMAVVDVFDALVSARPYKQAYPVSTVYKIIENESGKQFDPALVECFVKIRRKIEVVVYELFK